MENHITVDTSLAAMKISLSICVVIKESGYTEANITLDILIVGPDSTEMVYYAPSQWFLLPSLNVDQALKECSCAESTKRSRHAAAISSLLLLILVFLGKLLLGKASMIDVIHCSRESTHLALWLWYRT